MADDLPRPATPGPWGVVRIPDADWIGISTTAGETPQPQEVVDYYFPDDASGGVVHEQDAEAIAALPERIRRMDGIRRVAEDGLDYEPTGYQQGYAAACQAVLRWLDWEAA